MALSVGVTLQALLLATFALPAFGDSKPQLVVIMLDGMRWDYLDLMSSSELGGFRYFKESGVRVEYVQTVFPSLSLPAWTTLQTGLFPESHNVMGNRIYDRCTMLEYNASTAKLPLWWQDAEPFWVTVTRQGLRAATIEWNHADVPYRGWLPEVARGYSSSLEPFVGRINEVVWHLKNGFDLVMMYYGSIDDLGHNFGPASKPVMEDMRRVGQGLNNLFKYVKTEGLEDCVHVMVVSDHGMAPASSVPVVNLSQFIDVQGTTEKVLCEMGNVAIFVKPGCTTDLFMKLKAVPGFITKKREDIPDEYHYKGSRRAPDLLMYSAPPCAGAGPSTTRRLALGGGHGLDPLREPMMGAFFAAWGAAFADDGLVHPPLRLVDIYQLYAYVLRVRPLPHNGSWAAVRNLLRCRPRCEASDESLAIVNAGHPIGRRARYICRGLDLLQILNLFVQFLLVFFIFTSASFPIPTCVFAESPEAAPIEPLKGDEGIVQLRKDDDRDEEENFENRDHQANPEDLQFPSSNLRSDAVEHDAQVMKSCDCSPRPAHALHNEENRISEGYSNAFKDEKDIQNVLDLKREQIMEKILQPTETDAENKQNVGTTQVMQNREKSLGQQNNILNRNNKNVVGPSNSFSSLRTDQVKIQEMGVKTHKMEEQSSMKSKLTTRNVQNMEGSLSINSIEDSGCESAKKDLKQFLQNEKTVHDDEFSSETTFKKLSEFIPEATKNLPIPPITINIQIPDNTIKSHDTQNIKEYPKVTHELSSKSTETTPYGDVTRSGKSDTEDIEKKSENRNKECVSITDNSNYNVNSYTKVSSETQSSPTPKHTTLNNVHELLAIQPQNKHFSPKNEHVTQLPNLFNPHEIKGNRYATDVESSEHSLESVRTPRMHTSAYMKYIQVGREATDFNTQTINQKDKDITYSQNIETTSRNNELVSKTYESVPIIEEVLTVAKSKNIANGTGVHCVCGIQKLEGVIKDKNKDFLQSSFTQNGDSVRYVITKQLHANDDEQGYSYFHRRENNLRKEQMTLMNEMKAKSASLKLAFTEKIHALRTESMCGNKYQKKNKEERERTTTDSHTVKSNQAVNTKDSHQKENKWKEINMAKVEKIGNGDHLVKETNVERTNKGAQKIHPLRYENKEDIESHKERNNNINSQHSSNTKRVNSNDHYFNRLNVPEPDKRKGDDIKINQINVANNTTDSGTFDESKIKSNEYRNEEDTNEKEHYSGKMKHHFEEENEKNEIHPHGNSGDKERFLNKKYPRISIKRPSVQIHKAKDHGSETENHKYENDLHRTENENDIRDITAVTTDKNTIKAIKEENNYKREGEISHFKSLPLTEAEEKSKNKEILKQSGKTVSGMVLNFIVTDGGEQKITSEEKIKRATEVLSVHAKHLPETMQDLQSTTSSPRVLKGNGLHSEDFETLPTLDVGRKANIKNTQRSLKSYDDKVAEQERSTGTIMDQEVGDTQYTKLSDISEGMKGILLKIRVQKNPEEKLTQHLHNDITTETLFAAVIDPKSIEDDGSRKRSSVHDVQDSSRNAEAADSSSKVYSYSNVQGNSPRNRRKVINFTDVKKDRHIERGTTLQNTMKKVFRNSYEDREDSFGRRFSNKETLTQVVNMEKEISKEQRDPRIVKRVRRSLDDTEFSHNKQTIYQETKTTIHFSSKQNTYKTEELKEDVTRDRSNVKVINDHNLIKKNLNSLVTNTEKTDFNTYFQRNPEISSRSEENTKDPGNSDNFNINTQKPIDLHQEQTANWLTEKYIQTEPENNINLDGSMQSTATPQGNKINSTPRNEWEFTLNPNEKSFQKLIRDMNKRRKEESSESPYNEETACSGKEEKIMKSDPQIVAFLRERLAFTCAWEKRFAAIRASREKQFPTSGKLIGRRWFPHPYSHLLKTRANKCLF